MKFSKYKRRCNAWYWFFLDAIYYPQRENKNRKLLLNVTSHVFIISQFKKNTSSFFVFLLSLRKFFNVIMISSCKQELAAINLEICYSQCLGRIRCCRIWTLFPINLRRLVFPTMCVFHVLGIHLSQRTAMARVSLSAGSNFTDLRCARRFWFD